ncbi:MAG TPA: PilZ domain-containing protein [Terracidiphilus sp.]|nr:PilZ domain-containing protein [Terracidiphilus sp.]
MDTSGERRKRRRFPVNAPLTVIAGDREIPAYTRDLSDSGVFFFPEFTGENLIGSEFEFVVELPPEITLSACCFIRCRGRVVRREVTAGDLTGIAAEILTYSILPTAPSLA